MADEVVDQGPPTDAPEVAPAPSERVAEDTVAPAQEESKAAPWESYLEKFPDSLHPVAREVFTEWDGNVTKRFQDLHSTYEPYKPFVEQWEPESISEALQLAQALESNPKEFYKALAKAYGFTESEQGAENQPEESAPQELEYDPDDPLQARLAQQEELLRALSDKILGEAEAQEQARIQAEQDAQLEQAMNSLKEQHGEFDEGFVLTKIASGVDPEEAVKQFQTLVGTWAARQNAPATSAPRVIGAGGGLPSTQVDPANLNSKQTKDLVVELLRAQSGG